MVKVEYPELGNKLAQHVTPDSDLSNATVPRERYLRERKARLAAERRLEELSAALTSEAETLRLTLTELDQTRLREGQSLRLTSAMFKTLDAMTQAENADNAIAELLNQLALTFQGSVPLVLRAKPYGGFIEAAGLPELVGLTIPFAPDFLDRERRVADLHRLPLQGPNPAALGKWHALIVAPLPGMQDEKLAICCINSAHGVFRPEDQRLLSRIGGIAAQSLDLRRQASRTQQLAAVIAGQPSDDPATPIGGVVDAPFRAVNRALSRLTKAQTLVLDIFNTLLQSHDEDKDTVISKALRDLGGFIGCDRTYVFRTRNGDRLDNTHEWAGPDIEPMIEHLQDLEIAMFSDWMGPLSAGETILVEDVQTLAAESAERITLEAQGVRSLLLVPMVADGVLRGFMGYDSVKSARSFLPGEIMILRSIASAVDTVLSERDSRNQIESATNALAQERARLAATLGAMPDIVLDLSIDGRVMQVHAGTSQVDMAVIGPLIGQPISSALPPDLATKAMLLMMDAARTGEVRSMEFEFDFGFGPKWFTANGSRRIDSTGEAVGFVVVMRDTTLARWQTRELERLGEIARRTTNLVVITDTDRRIEWVNQSFVTRTGYTLDEVKGKNPGHLLQSGMTDKAEIARIGAALTKGEAVRAELLNKDRSGKLYWVDIDIQPLRGQDGSLRGFMAVQVDITALKDAEARALSDRAAAMDASLDGIALVGPDGRFQYMNKALRAGLGFESEEAIINRNWRCIFRPEEAKFLMEQVAPQLFQKNIWRGEVMGKAQNGDQVDMEMSLTRRPDNGLVVIARDISDRRRIDQERAKLRDELQLAQRREVIGQLAAGLAHDFNNLLATIAGSASLIEVSHSGDPLLMSHAARINAASEQATGLVRRLLNLGARNTRRSWIDLRNPLREATELLMPSLGSKIRLHLRLPKDRAETQADPTDILQIVLNLAINARDAMEHQGGDIHIRLAAATATDLHGPFAHGTPNLTRAYWKFSVEDNGSGMSAETADQIFLPYFSTKGDKGSGLGMAIIVGVLSANEGAVRLESALGKGTRFDVLWPVSTGIAEPESSCQAAADPSRQCLRGKAIMIVDDAEDLLEVLAAFLSTTGAEVAATTSPQDALEVIADDPNAWDLIVTDFDMGSLTGADLAARIHEMRTDLPVILVTALPDWTARARGTSAKFAKVLGKPVTREDLISAVESTLMPVDSAGQS